MQQKICDSYFFQNGSSSHPHRYPFDDDLYNICSTILSISFDCLFSWSFARAVVLSLLRFVRMKSSIVYVNLV